MALITLTSDSGLKDFYVSSIKGAILTNHPNATIIDISHQVPAFDVEVASFFVKNAYKSFPEGSIHLIDVGTVNPSNCPFLIVFANKHYFIGADTGIFSLILDQHIPEKIIEISKAQQLDLTYFAARDIFAPLACKIASGAAISELGSPVQNFKVKTNFMAFSDANSIRGNVIYIDNYGNVITNINRELFERARQNRKFGIQLKPSFKYMNEFSDFEISEICLYYDQVSEGEALALFNSSGQLEIAINSGDASGLLGLKNRDLIRVLFYDNENS